MAVESICFDFTIPANNEHGSQSVFVEIFDQPRITVGHAIRRAFRQHSRSNYSGQAQVRLWRRLQITSIETDDNPPRPVRFHQRCEHFRRTQFTAGGMIYSFIPYFNVTFNPIEPPEDDDSTEDEISPIRQINTPSAQSSVQN